MPLNPSDFRDQLVAVIYARVSQDKSKNLSVPAQVEWAENLCGQFGWSVSVVITDTDIGATRHSLKERPGYLELPDHLVPRVGEPRRVLITRSSSRANRRLGEHAMLRDLCAEHGTLWFSGGQLYDLDNPQDRRILGNEAVENEYGPEQNRFDSMQQLARNFAEGKPHSREAYGYAIVYRRGAAVDRDIDPVEAPIVREMVSRALALEPMRSIARWLKTSNVSVPTADMAMPCRTCSVTEGRKVLEAVDRRKCPCPKDWLTGWTQNTVRKVLLSPTIAGLRSHKDSRTGEVSTTPATWEPIIPIEQHHQLVALLTAPGRNPNTRGPAPRWLLSGIPLCGKCERGRLRARAGGNTRNPAYACENFCVQRDAQLLDDLVTETILRKLEDPELLDVLSRSSERTKALTVKAERMRADFDQWIAEAIDAGLSPIEIKRYKDSKEPPVKEAETRAKAAMPMPHVRAAAGPDARAIWADEDRTPLEHKRRVIRSLLSITVNPAGKKQGFGARAGVETIDIQPLVA